MIEIKIEGTDRAVARLSSMSDILRQSLRDAIERQWFALQAAVVTEKLSGDPLHRRTALLASSINVGAAETVTAFEESPEMIVGRVGTKVRYAAVHEYGGTFSIPAHQRRMTQVFGRYVAPKEISVGAHSATFPERSFLRSTFRDMASQMRDAIEKSVADATKR